MTDATADQPATPPDPDEPLAHDGPTFVHNGIIRFAMGDRVVRVRRPFLGELKVLRLALQQVQDDLAEESRRVAGIGRSYVAQQKELNEARQRDEITAEEHTARLKEVSDADMATARELDDKREQMMLDWWRDSVFGPLALDEVPDQLQWPTWMLDRTLSGKCLTHWRTVPTGPG